MPATSLTRRLTSNPARAKNSRPLNPNKRRVRLLLELLEGRDLPAPLTIAPSILEGSVGAPIGLHTLTATGGPGVVTTYLDASAGLAFPEGLAFDSSGNLYVTNASSSTVSKVTPDGTVSVFVPSSAGLSDPEGLAFDSSGNLYVANDGSNTVSEVTPNGLVSTFVPASAGLSGPESLAFDSSGNLYVANFDNNTVSQVTPSGAVSTFVPASAGLSDPEGLAFDGNGNLYVANYGNNSVSEVTPSGIVSTFLSSFSSNLSGPIGLAFDSSGNLYVANHGNDTVSQVTPGGTISSFVPASAGLTGVNSLTFDSGGNLYVANGGNNTVSKVAPAPLSFTLSTADAANLAAIGLTLNLNGTFSGDLTSVPSPNPLTFTVNVADTLGDSGSNVIALYVTQPVIFPTSLETSVGASPGLPPLAVAGQGNSMIYFVTDTYAHFFPQAIAVDSSGNLFMADPGRNLVNEVAPSGTISSFIPASAGLSGPEGLAFGSDGNLYVANFYSDTISSVTPGGVVNTFVPASAGLSGPDALAFDSNGNLFVANANNNTVSEITPAGVVSTFVPASAGLSEPGGLAFDSRGNLFVSNSHANTVSEVMPGGIISTFVPASAGLADPIGLAFDNHGILYVANHDSSNPVIEVTPDGTVATPVPQFAFLPESEGLAFDSNGNLYVSNNGFVDVAKVVPSAPSFAVSAADAARLSAIGLTLNADGTFSGTVTSLPSINPLTFTVTVTDALGDWGSAEISLMVDQKAEQKPTITSANSTTFSTGAVGSFTITATGFPTPTLSEVGALPDGVNFNTATGVLHGTPSVDMGGNYLLTFTASNGIGSDATQDFTLTVDQTPAITSAASTSFAVGTVGSFTVTDNGFPAPTLSESSTDVLPDGVTFDAATGVLSGTPVAGTIGTYSLQFTADNGNGSAATQTFKLNVTDLPTSAVAILPVFSPRTFQMTWSGTPGFGATGIATYDIYSSVDGGPFTLFLHNTEQTSLNFGGEDGSTYGFYSVATDNAGNVQPTSTSAQATTTVDATPPTSSVQSLPAFENTTAFPVSWSGSDNAGGSGVASYSVYVSDDGDTFTPFLTDTTETSATFNGQDGHSYSFFSIATDNVGNVQDAPTKAQASTSIDTVAPTSTVQALPVLENSASFAVSWSGSDNLGGSGIASYTIYVSEDGGSFRPFVSNTVQTSVTFAGQNGHTYAFYSVATDNAGNVQATPTSAQATTTVDTTAPTSAATALPVFTKPSFTVSWTGQDDPGGPGIVSYSIYVSDDGGAFMAWMTATRSTSALYQGLAGHTYSFYSMATDKLGKIQPTPTSAQASTQTLLDTPSKQYVDAVYSLVLGRAPDVTGLDYWSGQLDLGVPRSTLINLIDHSAEYFGTIIQPAYLQFLGRAADQNGLAYWTNRLIDGLTDEQLEADFIGSAEFYQKAGATDKGWVDALYQSLLSRPADPTGEAFWVGQLEDGVSRASVAYGFAASSEREGQLVMADYEKYLGRIAGASEVAYWVGQFSIGVTNEDIVSAFVSSDEFYSDHTS